MNGSDRGVRCSSGMILSDKFRAGNRRQKGFTLVELVVVLIIIAILAAIAIPTLIGFIDRGREKQYQANAEAALAATQTTLTDLYSDANSCLSPKLREKARETAGLTDTDCEFTVWTKEQLFDGKTKALPENISSFTVYKALYQEKGVYFVFDGDVWEIYETEDEARAALGNPGTDNEIYMWPYSRDYAYIGSYNPDGSESSEGEEDEDIVKVVTLNLPTSDLNYVYFSRKDGNGGENAGITSVKVLFWKETEGENKVVKSYWTVEGGTDVFQVDSYYTYVIRTKPGCSVLRWVKTADENVSFTYANAYNEICEYIYNDANKNVVEFDFTAVTEVQLGAVEEVTVSKNRFKTVFESEVTEMEWADPNAYTADELSAARRTRVDDESVEDGYIYAWHDDTNPSKLMLWSNATTCYMPADCSNFFYNNTKVKYFSFSGFNLSKITTMKNIFYGASNLSEVVLGPCGSVTDVSGMFQGCSALANVNLNSFSTGALTSATAMFKNCGLGSITLPSTFNTSGLTTLEEMFAGCGAGTINIEEIDVTNVKILRNTFNGCTNLSTLHLPKDANNEMVAMEPTSLENTFKDCQALTSLDLSKWNTVHLTSLSGTFSGCTSMTELNLSDWNVLNITSLNSAFKGLSSLTNLNLGARWNLKNCTDMTSAFEGCSSLTNDTNGFASVILTSYRLTSLKNTFKDCSSLTSINLSSFDTLWVSDMSGLFSGCKNLETIKGLEKMDTSHVANMEYMFAYTESLTELDLSKFSTDRVTRFKGMFKYESVNNVPKTSLTTIYASPRFKVATAFQNQVMFENATKLVGGRGTAFSEVLDTHSSYAYIDGRDGKPGYFKDKSVKVYVNRGELQKFFKGGYGHAKSIQMVDPAAYTVDDVKTFAGVHSIKADYGTKNDCFLYAWMDGDVVKWWSDADLVCMYGSYADFLSGVTTVESFDFTGFDVTEVTSMSNMFKNASNLKSVTLGNSFYADNVETVASMFSGCGSLTTVDLNNMTAGANNKLTTMQYMFSDCGSLTSLPAFGSNFNSTKVTSLLGTFMNCSSLTSLDVSGLTVGDVTTMENTFKGCSSLKSIQLGSEQAKWDLSNCTNMISSFDACTSLTGVDFSNVITSNKLNSIKNLFRGDTNLQSVDLSPLDISGLKTLTGTFQDCSGMTNLIFNNGNASIISNRDNLFTGCDNLTNITMQGWKFTNATQVGGMVSTCPADGIVLDYSNAEITMTSLYQMFQNRSKLKEINLSGWGGTDKITSLSYAFAGCTQLETVDFTGWKTGKQENGALTSIESMFANCSSLVSPGLGALDVSKVTTMKKTFVNCTSLELDELDDNNGVDNWNTESLTSLYSTFEGCSAFTSLEAIKNWNVSKVTDLCYTFKKCSGLTSLDLSAWDVQKVTTIQEMFIDCSSLETVDWSGWNLKSVNTVVNAFKGCKDLTTVYVYSDFSPKSYNTSVFEGCDSLVGGKGTAYADYPTNYTNGTYMWPDGVAGRNEGKGYFTCRQKIAFIKKLGTVDGNNWVQTELGGTAANITSFVKGTAPVPDTAKNLKDENKTLPGGSINELADVWFWIDGTTVKWYSEADVVYVHEDASGMFEGWTAATNIVLPSELNYENVTNVSAMFKDCTSLVAANVGPLSAAPFTDMSNMFSGCGNLTTLVSFTGLNTSIVANMSGMFKDCASLATIDLSSFTTEALTDTSSMFEGCTSLNSLKLGPGFTCKNVITMESMFKNCSSLVKLDLTTFDNTSEGNQLTNTASMFSGCTSLTTIYTLDPVINNGVGFENKDGIVSTGMFTGCTTLVGGCGTAYDAAHTDGSYYAYADKDSRRGYYTDRSVAAKKYAYMKDTTGSNWGGNITNYGTITSFSRNTLITSENDLPANKKDFTASNSEYKVYVWQDGTNVYWWSEADVVYIGNSCKSWFQDWTSLVTVNLTDLDATNVTSLESMFQNCQKLASVTFGELFNTKNVTTTLSMFAMSQGGNYNLYNDSLVEIDLTPFKTTSLTVTRDMFTRCRALERVYADPTQWKGRQTGQGLTGDAGRTMFKGCTKIHGWVKVGDAYVSKPTGNINDNGNDTTSATYARVDEPGGEHGYFWVKQ